jgi:hypothetical protein
MLPKNVSRRRAAMMLGAAPLLDYPNAAVAAQQPAPATTPPATDDLAIQRQNMSRWRQRLRQVKVPIGVEPAFSFKP